MSDKQCKQIKYGIVIVPHVTSRPPKPHWIKTSYQIAIANFERHKIVTVDSTLFFRTKVGYRYTFK